LKISGKFEVCFVATRDYAVNEDDEIGTKIE
jgi:hypothetical protein